MTKEGGRKMKKSVRENFGSEVDLVDRGHVILEMHHVIKRQPFSLAYRMVANDPLLCRYVAQMNTLNMVPHVRNAVKGTRSLLVWKPLVSDANNTLGLLADDRKFIRRWEGSGRSSFDQILGGGSRPRLASLKLLSRGERDHEVDGSDLSGDDGLRAQVFGEIAKNLL
jgi:hypothetical protein